MKKFLPFIVFMFSTVAMMAQCDELFISEYVEGYGNNRALELYNPTNAAIDLSAYSVGRFSNGESTYKGVDLPADMIEAYGTYVIVIDKRDSLGTGFELPVWNGYQMVEPRLDSLTGEVVLNNSGDTIFNIVYDLSTGNAIPVYGTEYNDFVDLEGKADVFLCPVYAVNEAMYFNGNDAVALVKGSEVALDGSNLIDVIGVIGENPGDFWATSFGSRITQNMTIERNPDIKLGTGIVAASNQDTFAYDQYWRYWNNYFDGLGAHDCECDPDYVASTSELNQVAFSMFPNPTSNDLAIIAEENINRVEIYNMIGERVLMQDFGKNTFSKIELSVGNFDNGMYLINLYFDEGKQSIQKFIKQ